MKEIAQFRYYNSAGNKNYPADIKASTWYQGNIFQGCGVISHLGIQGYPGVRFYLNGSKSAIMIGETGIYEINLENLGRIYSIQFIKEDLEKFYDTVNQEEDINKNRILIVDIIYEKAGINI